MPSHALLTVVLVFEGALLFVAANTGFLGGPAVLANMAADRWVPNQFSALSSRLVTRNGVLLMGAAALAILAWTEGQVALLVVLYTVNVFITFTLSLLGLTNYWWKRRRDSGEQTPTAAFRPCARHHGGDPRGDHRRAVPAGRHRHARHHFVRGCGWAPDPAPLFADTSADRSSSNGTGAG